MDTNSFVRKLRNGSDLTTQDENALSRLVHGTQRVGTDADIVIEHEPMRSLVVILEGWACRYKQLENGKRQITSFFLPGDLCEPFGILPTLMYHSLGALTPITFAAMVPTEIRELARSSTRIEEALWWDVLSAMAMMHERVVSLGRRSAFERLGHLFCEFYHRLGMVGLVDESGFDFPVTQADLADALGLSTVHINRSLQEFRSANLIRLHARRLTILNLGELKAASCFDPTFLHTRPRNGKN